MKRLEKKYRDVLKKYASSAASNLITKISDKKVVVIKNPHAIETYTFGYYITLFKFKGVSGRGTIEMWLDCWANVGRPILSICFWSADIDRINRIANYQPEIVNTIHYGKTKFFPAGQVLAKPLDKQLFNKFIVEPYTTKWLTYYFSDEIKEPFSLSKYFLNKICKQTEWLVRTTAEALEVKSNVSEDYFAFENRQIVANHKRRDRSKILADEAKKRDRYRCKVCDFNFLEKYGPLGINYAESHHLIPLSSLNENVKTRSEDLITVCANCHRMLHKMQGKKDDFETLKKIIVRNF